MCTLFESYFSNNYSYLNCIEEKFKQLSHYLQIHLYFFSTTTIQGRRLFLRDTEDKNVLLLQNKLFT